MEGNEVDPKGAELFQRDHQMPETAREPVVAVDQDAIEMSAPGVGHHRVEVRATVLPVADSLIDVFTGDGPAAALDVLAQLAGLHRNILAVVCCAHSPVQSHVGNGRFALSHFAPPTCDVRFRGALLLAQRRVRCTPTAAIASAKIIC